MPTSGLTSSCAVRWYTFRESGTRRYPDVLLGGRLAASPSSGYYNTGIFTYIWLLRNQKPASHRGRVMLIDARQQFEKEPKSFGNTRNRMTDAHRQWIEERDQKGWTPGCDDEHVKLFHEKDLAFHKVKVVFWQTDEHDQSAIITEPYEKAFTAANLAKEQAFHDSDLTFRVRVRVDNIEKTVEFWKLEREAEKMLEGLSQ